MLTRKEFLAKFKFLFGWFIGILALNETNKLKELNKEKNKSSTIDGGQW